MDKTMSSPDDVEYRKSVRNMSAVLAAIVITIFAALIIPPYLNPVRPTFQEQVSATSPYGFTLTLEINSTSISSTGHIAITAWVNSTSSTIENVTAKDAWALDRAQLWGRICTSGWPMGVGVMQGHYTLDNFSQGTLLHFPQPLVLCPVMRGQPQWFALAPHSSKALVSPGGIPTFWILQSTLTFGSGNLPLNLTPGPRSSGFPAGVYTAVAADEWGDVVTTNFSVS
jgi:hypothetical protein